MRYFFFFFVGLCAAHVSHNELSPPGYRLAFGLPTSSIRCSVRSEEHTSELQSLRHLVCRLLLEKKKRALLDRHLGDGWLARATDPATWAPVDDIPADELWADRRAQRAALIDYVRHRSVHARLGR